MYKYKSINESEPNRKTTDHTFDAYAEVIGISPDNSEKIFSNKLPHERFPL
jgi:hypothetical protein